MDTHTATPVTTVAERLGESDRRHGSRTPTLFSLLYSGIDTGRMLVGDGIGIRGNRSVTPGMEMAIFVDLPGVEEPLCIAQNRVYWVVGRRFGEELGTLKLEEKNHLQFFLGNRITPSDGSGGI